MNSKKLFLTSSGLSADMKKKFFDIIGKCPEDVKVLYIPTAGIETDGAREGFAVCFQELSSMGIRYENILVYNLELILSKDYQRTYSTCVTDPYMLTRLLTIEELQSFDAVVVSGGDAAVLCREMIRTGFDRTIEKAIICGNAGRRSDHDAEYLSADDADRTCDPADFHGADRTGDEEIPEILP